MESDAPASFVTIDSAAALSAGLDGMGNLDANCRSWRDDRYKKFSEEFNA